MTETLPELDPFDGYWLPFGEGFDAYRTGAICRYAYTSPEARWWREGHREAEQRHIVVAIT